MAQFFKTSSIWAVEFQYKGSPRRWLRAFPPQTDVRAAMAAALHDLYGERARLVEVRPATAEEEGQYLRGEAPVNVVCPTGR